MKHRFSQLLSQDSESFPLNLRVWHRESREIVESAVKTANLSTASVWGE